MELTNILQKCSQSEKDREQKLVQLVYPVLLQCLYPFAPHLASDVWDSLYKSDIRKSDFKSNILVLEKLCQDTNLSDYEKFKINVNGKFLGNFNFDKSQVESITEDEII